MARFEIPRDADAEERWKVRANDDGDDGTAGKETQS
jgi:hypothetical protein